MSAHRHGRSFVPPAGRRTGAAEVPAGRRYRGDSNDKSAAARGL
jgi:hypothetical protein